MKKYDSYKDSGIGWLGEIPNHWKVTKLKFIGDAIGGLTYAPNNVVENKNKGVLVLRSSNIQNGKLSLDDNVYVDLEISDKLTLKKGDILICSRNGSQHLIGKNICIDERTEGSTFGAFMMIFRSKHYGFLNQYFNSPIFTSQSGLFLTATINQLTSGTLNNFYIAIPESIDEQIQIANFLDHKTTQIDTLISKKEQFISLLQEERIAVINQAVTKGLDPKAKMKDSGIEWLGEIPEHWEVKPLKYIIKCNNEALNEKTNPQLEIKYIEIGDVSSSNGIQCSTSYLFSEAPSRARRIVREGDVIISTVRTYLKAISPITKELDGYIASTGFAVLTPQKINSSYLGFIALTDGVIGEIISMSKGVSYPSITSQDLVGISIPYPNNDEQIKIANYLFRKTSEIDTIISKTQQEIELLKEYKMALISEVVTGKVDVREEILN